MSASMIVGITADRRWEEQARLFADRGAGILHGPTLRTIDLSGSEALRAATEAVVDQPPDYLVVTTGMGMRRWLEAAAGWDLEWDARPGEYRLRARTRDHQGSTQPESVPFNEQGYLYGAVVDHPVSVR